MANQANTTGSEGGGEAGGLVDGALGVELGGHVGATDDVHRYVVHGQGVDERALGLLTRADDHVVDVENPGPGLLPSPTVTCRPWSSTRS